MNHFFLILCLIINIVIIPNNPPPNRENNNKLDSLILLPDFSELILSIIRINEDKILITNK